VGEYLVSTNTVTLLHGCLSLALASLLKIVFFSFHNIPIAIAADLSGKRRGSDSPQDDEPFRAVSIGVHLYHGSL